MEKGFPLFPLTIYVRVNSVYRIYRGLNGPEYANNTVPTGELPLCTSSEGINPALEIHRRENEKIRWPANKFAIPEAGN